MEGQHSDRVPVTSGVPPGSVIGPCQFLHLLERIESTVRLLADGTVMYPQHALPICQNHQLVDVWRCMKRRKKKDIHQLEMGQGRAARFIKRD